MNTSQNSHSVRRRDPRSALQPASHRQHPRQCSGLPERGHRRHPGQRPQPGNGTRACRPNRTNAVNTASTLFLPGNYQVEVAKAGFRTFHQTGVALQVGQFARVDVRLEVGEASARSPSKARLRRQHHRRDRRPDREQGADHHRCPWSIAPSIRCSTLTPGVQITHNAIALGFPAQRTFINGGADATMGSVNYYLDGGSNVSSLRNTGNTPPNPDAVEEFRVDTNNYSAEYGRFGNGVINVITRSGTNQFPRLPVRVPAQHTINANTYNALIKPPLHRNQFGGSFGGPIVKNKTFFFGTYSGLRQTTSTSSQFRREFRRPPSGRAISPRSRNRSSIRSPAIRSRTIRFPSTDRSDRREHHEQVHAAAQLPNNILRAGAEPVQHRRSVLPRWTTW